MLALPVLFLASLLSPWGQANDPLPVDTKSLHVVKKTEPVYPPIASSANVGGNVKIRIVVGTDGHVKSSTVATGPALLAEAAQDCVRDWIFEPVLDAAGKPVIASALVTVTFHPGTSGRGTDAKTAQEFLRLRNACVQKVTQKAAVAEQAADCLRAAQAGEALPADERFPERRDAFVYASTALLRNQQVTQALLYANKAVAVVEQGHDDDAGVSAAYSVRAQAEAVSGDLQSATKDLAVSEQHERDAIRKMAGDAPDLVRLQYKPTLKYLLYLEARVLAAQGQSSEAAEKTKEASTL